MRSIKLRKGEDRRIRRGHLWIYSNEIADEVKKYEAGESVSVLDYQGKPVGSGFVNPHSLIAVRMYSSSVGKDLDLPFLVNRFERALSFRRSYGYKNVMRLINGEGDLLPGLIIDLFDTIAVIQHNSQGFHVRRDLVLAALNEVIKPKTIIIADDSPARLQEGLEQERFYYGDDPPEIHWYELDGLLHPLDLEQGQKTGTYLDQAHNHRLISDYAKDKNVVDGFSYTGGFGLYAARAGAHSVTLIDSSQKALDLAGESFSRNSLPAPQLLKADLLHDDSAFTGISDNTNLIILDPPPLVKNKKSLKAGLKLYESLASKGLERISQDGLLAFFSCSHHVERAELAERLARAGTKSRRRLKQLCELSASPDHPLLLSHRESNYLNGFLVQC